MLKKNKKITLLLSGLSGVLLASSAAGVALASCSTTSSSSSSSTDVQYSYVIDWNNKDAVDRLIIDDNGLVYSDNAMTTIIAVSPKVKLTTIKIPSRVKSIMGYSRVMYKNNTTNALVDQIPTGENASSYTKVYKSYGAFQDMESLETVALESGSQLQSIGGSAFSGCTTLKNITGLSNSLEYIGALAFTNCSDLEAIDLSNVINIGAGAFTNCSSLTSLDLSNTFYIGDYAFQNCSGLTKIGSLKQVRTLGLSAFQSAFASGSNVTLELNNLLNVPTSAFQDAQGIGKVDFSGNTLLSYVDAGAFIGSSVATVDFTGCSNLSEIRERAFKDCASLTTVYLPVSNATSLKTIGSNAFLNCASLTTVAPSSGSTTTGFVATSKLSTIGAYSLANTAITLVDLSSFAVNNSSTTPFGSTASLAFMANLKEVKLPDTLTTLNAGLFYGSGLGTNAGFSLTLPSTITNIEYKSSLSIATDSSNIDSSATVSNVTPFTNSGITSIDMSKITSYQSTANNQNIIPNYLFNGDAKLTSVVLKNGTTGIGDYAFQGTIALNYVTYPASSEADAIAEITNGFTASDDLTTIGTDAFKGAFSATSNAALDLSAMSSLTNTPKAFNGSNIASVKLPKTIKVIEANSFDNMSKLTSFNFGDLTALTTIWKSNFNGTLLKSIDLSGLSNAGSLFQGTVGSLFTNLPSDCVVSLPSSIGNFSDVFTDSNGAYVRFSYPNGISTSLLTITNGVLSFKTSGVNTNLTSNINTLDLSSQTTITSIGTNSFFGNNKLSSLTLPAKGISTKNIFTANTGLTANTNNQSNASSVYTKENVPFGDNEGLSLNYKGFTVNTASTVDTAADTTAQTTLFNTTDATTWNEVAKIINSLSYQASASSEETAKASKANMSEWTVSDTKPTDPMNSDENPTFTASTKVVLNKSYASTTATAVSAITINAADESATFVHNGITWTYKNDGNNITLTGAANMYKATDTATTAKNYLVFFNQSTYTVTGTTNIYYVPSQTSVKVTLTIATKASSNSNL